MSDRSLEEIRDLAVKALPFQETANIGMYGREECVHFLFSLTPARVIEMIDKLLPSPVQGEELPERPNPDCVLDEGGCGFSSNIPAYHTDTAEAHFTALEAEIGRLKGELSAKDDAVCEWESREASVANEEETFEQVIESLREAIEIMEKAS